MNIFNAIGSGVLKGVQGVGTASLAAGKGLADYLNAQALRQSGLTPEQLQQNPQLAKSAMGNWLGSIGQGMQTGDYTGSRLGYQQEMLTKLQNLQAMKQQDAAKQRQAAFQQAMGQAQTPEDLAKIGMAFPEQMKTVSEAMEQYKALSGMKTDEFTRRKLEADTYKAWIDTVPKPPGVDKWEPGISSDGQNMVLYGLKEDGSVIETPMRVPRNLGQGGGYSIDQITGQITSPEPREATTPDITNYNLDVRQGYTGTFAQWRAKNSAASGVGAAPQQAEALAITDGIIRGDTPPSLTNLPRAVAATVQANLAKAGFNLVEATNDQIAIKRHLQSLNGPQQLRLTQAVAFTSDILENVDALYDKWRSLAKDKGFKLLNYADLAASRNSADKNLSSAAINLEAQINDFTAELAQVYRGGNASTDEAMEKASANLKAEWNQTSFKNAVEQLRKSLTYRRNSIKNSGVSGLSENSIYQRPGGNNQSIGGGNQNRPPLGSFGPRRQ